jgi:hypothetical protein
LGSNKEIEEMVSKRFGVFFVACVSFLLITCQVRADLYSGSLTYDGDAVDTGIIATGSWADSGTRIEWDITKQGSNYHYEYKFTVPAKDISHLILQVSDSFETENIWNISGGVSAEGPTDYDSNSNDKSNPGLPGTIYGIKFEPSADSTTLTWSFNSDREPIWGNFYAKDGKEGTCPVLLSLASDTCDYHIDVYAYSSGLIDGEGFIAVPDTNVVPVPSAIFLGFLGLSIAGVKLRKIA